VANALRSVPGVERAECDFSTTSATVWLNGTPLCTTSQLIDAVESMGFEAFAPPPSLCLTIDGMMCQVSLCTSDASSFLLRCALGSVSLKKDLMTGDVFFLLIVCHLRFCFHVEKQPSSLLRSLLNLCVNYIIIIMRCLLYSTCDRRVVAAL